MNAKKFNLELQKAIQLKTITSNWVLNLYRNDKVSYLHHVPVSELLKQNYTTIIKECKDTDLISMVNIMYQYKEMQPTIKDNYILLIQKCKTLGEFKELLRAGYLDNKKYFNDNLEILLGNIPNEYIFFLSTKNKIEKDLVKNRDGFFKEKNQEILDKFLTENKKEYIEFLFFRSDKEKTKEEEISIDLVLELIEEILEHENLKYKDIQYIGGGGFSEIIKIGTKIIKIGKKRHNYEIPYDKTILQPIIRVDLSKISNIDTTIEVMENVDTNFFISKEEQYQFYVSLRERGIIFADIKAQNLGILLKDNKVHWDKKISLDNVNKGIKNTYEEEVLKKGELVILDTDYLYTEEDFQKIFAKEGMMCWGSEEAIEFEERYQKSKHKKGKNNR